MLSSNHDSINDNRINQSINDSQTSIDSRLDNCYSDFWKKTSATFNRYVLFLIAAFRYVSVCLSVSVCDRLSVPPFNYLSVSFSEREREKEKEKEKEKQK